MGMRIALLRAVNVGGNRKVAMTDLRDLLAELGLENGRTLLQSGNLVFSSDAAPGALEKLLEREAKRRLDLDTAFFVRTAAEWQRTIESNPFPDEAEADPSRLVVMPLKSAPKRGAAQALQDTIEGRERVRVVSKTAYIVYPDGIGRSRLTNAALERGLDTVGTGRNWNTVLKLASAAER
jgi:uncharacterized protein (DUF1697 family)